MNAGSITVEICKCLHPGLFHLLVLAHASVVVCSNLSLARSRIPDPQFWLLLSRYCYFSLARAQERLPGSLLPTLSLQVNGVAVPALLDTGSPITVLNAAAATAAGVMTVTGLSGSSSGAAAGNPFAAFASNMKAAQALARGDIIQIPGANGKPTQLHRSLPLTMAVAAQGGAAEGGVGFGECQCYVGELPGLAALDGLGAGEWWRGCMLHCVGGLWFARAQGLVPACRAWCMCSN